MRTKKLLYSFSLFMVITIILFSCKKSPANISVGEYHGTAYMFDTIVAGNCTTNVVEVNSLTVNFMIAGDSIPSTTLNNVEVNGGDEPYSLLYDGIEGSLTGTITQNEMHWVWFGVDDTISFIGVKQ